MSGRLTLAPLGAPAELHEHLVFELDSGQKLRFRDPRRFGLAMALPTARLERDRHFRHLGIEPLNGDFDGPVLAAAARGRRGPVKSFLMDVRIMVVVCYIYANAAHYHVGLHP